ncbi:MAG: protease pro-enzyme activation domain-containing protein, partial [Acidobacteriaceae bacterium]
MLLAALTICGTGAGHAQQSRQVLHNHVNPAVTGGQAALMGPLPSEQRMQVSIVLPLRNQAELTGLLKRLYDPSSPDYRQFLSVDQFTERFGPTIDDYLAVVAFAQANGFTVTASPANRLVVPLSGTVDQIDKAFNVKMNVYQHPTESRTFFSPDREPSLNLSVPVAHISGLSNFSLPHPMVIPPRKPQTEDSGPVLGSGPGGSYLSSDMRAAYYGGTTLDGNGQTVGLLEYDGYDLSDVASTFSTAGQTYNVAINNVLLDGATGAPSGESDAEAEVVLDIVQAIGMAPGLTQVRVYIGQGLDDANLLNSMASENIAKQISSSWSWFPDDPQTDDVFFEEFAAQGQSFFDASGDLGAYDPDVDPYFYPAEDAYVTAVGGTHLTTNGAGGTWASEVAWDSPPNGSGGGISPDGIAIPSWQSGLANTSNGGSPTLRNVPDVAMEGDFDNYLCSMGYCEAGWAGTSFAAPRWAGFMALVNQQAVEAGTAPQGGVGFINPPLYAIGQGASYSNDLHDITSGNNDTDNQPVSYSAVSGYDLVTGWGSPTGPDLIDDLAGPQAPGFWIIGSPATVSLDLGSSSTTTFTVTDAGGFTGNVTLAVTSPLPTGVTASWGANPTASTSVLTLTASSTAPASTAPLTITGTSGNLTATTSVTVAVHTPTFALSASPYSLGIPPNASGSAAITVTPEYGFTGNVNLTIAGLPAGVTASFSPTSTNSGSTLTLNVSSTAVGSTTTLTITGTSGNLTVTTPLTLTVQAPTFQLYTPPEVDIGLGTAVSTYVYVNAYYGFAGNVNLTIAGLPSGVTAYFSPNPATYSSTLWFNTTNAATPGQYTLTITGTSGNITATTPLTLVIHQPTFTISDYGSGDIGQGSSSTSYVYVNAQYGFTGNVTMSVSGLPSGVTALWAPNPTTYGTALTLSVSPTAAPGTSTLTITGTSGSIVQTTTFTLTVHVPGFSLSNNGAVNIGQGTTYTSGVYVDPQYGFTGSVNLSVSGLPSGVTASLSPNPTTGYSALTLTVSSTAPIGTSTLTITGTSGNLTATTTVTLGIFAPTFTLYGYSPGSIGQGTSATGSIYINPEYGFAGNVSLAVSGLPSGVTASFSPNPTTTTDFSELTLTASSTATVGTSTITVTGTSGSQTATSTFSFSVATPTFTLSDEGGVTMGQGTTTTTFAWVYGQYGFTGAVNLSISGLPAGVTASFSPNPTTYGSTLTLTASSTAPVGQYNLTVTGTSGTQTMTTPLSLGVYAPTFMIYGGGLTLGQGSSGATYVDVDGEYGFTGSVNFSITGLPTGVTASFSPNPTPLQSILTLTAGATATPGQYTLTVTGTSGSQTQTTTVFLEIDPPSFTLSTVYNLSMNQGTSTSATVYVYPQYGFTGVVSFAAAGLPSGVTASFSPNPTSSNPTLTLTASDAATPGQATVTITGTSGASTATTTIYLTINPQGFTIVAAPGQANLIPGGSADVTVGVIPAYGFAGDVTLAVTGLPSGVTAAFSPNPTSTGSSVMTLTASSTAAPGSATLTITGTSGSLAATSTVVVAIRLAPSATTTTLQITAAGSPVGTVSPGTPVTLTAAVNAGPTALAVGEVNFCDAAATLCDPAHWVGSAQLTNAGTAALKFIPGMGTHSYKAVFLATSSHATSSSSAANLTVTPAAQPTTTTITPSGVSGDYTLTATVSAVGAVAPTGTVSFLDTSNSNFVLATAPLRPGAPTLVWANP